MKTTELKVSRIGNSRGVRLPARTLQRYHVGDVLLMEEREEGIFLHPKPSADGQLSWEDTARAMAKSQENWADWNGTAGDGIDGIPWEHRTDIVAEQRASYQTKSRRKGLTRDASGAV